MCCVPGARRTPGHPAAPPHPEAPPPPRPPRRFRPAGLWPYLLIAPTLAGTAYLLVYPLVRSVVISFQHFRLGELIRGGAAFVGFDNYAEVLGGAEFWTVLRRTLVWTAVNVVLIMLISTLVALMLPGSGAGCGSR